MAEGIRDTSKQAINVKKGVFLSYSLMKCSSKPLLVFCVLVMNSSHMELEVEFRVVSSSSLPVNTPSSRALLLLPSKT